MSPINYKSVTGTGPKILKHAGTINLGSSGPSGTSDKLVLTKIAGVNITSFKAVYLQNDLAYLYNPTNQALYNRLIGFAITGALTGEPIQILTGGLMNVSFPVIDGAIYYVSSASLPVTTPNASGISVEIGTGVGTNSIFVNLNQPFLLLD